MILLLFSGLEYKMGKMRGVWSVVQYSNHNNDSSGCSKLKLVSIQLADNAGSTHLLCPVLLNPVYILLPS